MLVLLMGLPTCQRAIGKTRWRKGSVFAAGKKTNPIGLGLFLHSLCLKSCFCPGRRIWRKRPLCPQTPAWPAPSHRLGPAAGGASARGCVCRRGGSESRTKKKGLFRCHSSCCGAGDGRTGVPVTEFLTGLELERDLLSWQHLPPLTDVVGVIGSRALDVGDGVRAAAVRQRHPVEVECRVTSLHDGIVDCKSQNYTYPWQIQITNCFSFN